MAQIQLVRDWGTGTIPTALQVTTSGLSTSSTNTHFYVRKMRGGVRYLLADITTGVTARYGHLYGCTERPGIEQRNRISHSGMISGTGSKCIVFHLRGHTYVEGSFSTASLFRSVAFFGRRAYAVSQSETVRKYLVRGGLRLDMGSYIFDVASPLNINGCIAVAHIGAHLWFFESGGTTIEIWHPHDDNAKWNKVGVLAAPVAVNALSYDGKFIWIWNTAAGKLYQCSIRS